MNRNLSALLAYIATALCAAVIGGAIMSYRANTMLVDCVAAGPMSDNAAMQLNFQQLVNILAAGLASIGGFGGLVTFLVNWWKTGEPTLIVNELREKVNTGDTKGALTFAALVAGITAGRQFFKGANNESSAEQHWKALLPLAAEAEFERNK